MNKILFLSIAIGLAGIFSCESDFAKVDKNKLGEDSIETRNKEKGECLSGNFTEEDYMLKFIDDKEFNQTIDFLSCASDSELEEWRSNHPIQTSMKAIISFEEASSYGKINSFDELIKLEEEYAGKIKLVIDEEVFERTHELEYDFLSDIVDTDGLFMIEDDMLRLDKGRIIRVRNTTRDKILEMDMLTPPVDPDKIQDGDVIENEEIELRGGEGCCPSSGNTERFFLNDGFHKLSLRYRITEKRRKRKKIIDGKPRIFRSLQVNLSSSLIHYKKKNFLLWSYWANEDTNLSIDSHVKFHYTAKIPTDNGIVTLDEELEKSATVSKNNTSNIRRSSLRMLDLENYISHEICVKELNVEGKDLLNNESAILSCASEEEELPVPVIIFYEDNDLGGDIVCALDLDPSVGYLNFTSYAPCKNDQVRSARLLNMREGMRFRVFDNSEMKLDDDFTIVDIKRDFNSRKINSFEKNVNDNDMTVNYFEDNGLDGKISAFIDN